MKFSLRTPLIGALSVLPLVFATPASADVPIGGGGTTANDCQGLHCFVAVLTADVQPIGNTGLALVAWNCQATGTIDPVSTSITRCSVGHDGAAPITLPGAFAATAGTTVALIGSQVMACVAGQSAFAENVLGSQIVLGESCAPLVIVRLGTS